MGDAAIVRRGHLTVEHDLPAEPGQLAERWLRP